MIVLLLLVIIAILLVGAARVRGCSAQMIVLLIIAYLSTELMDRLSAIPSWVFWVCGAVLLAVMATLAYMPPAQPQKRQTGPRPPRNMDEYLARQREAKSEPLADDHQKPHDPAQ